MLTTLPIIILCPTVVPIDTPSNSNEFTKAEFVKVARFVIFNAKYFKLCSGGTGYSDAQSLQLLIPFNFVRLMHLSPVLLMSL
jgi:hypothetical protein